MLGSSVPHPDFRDVIQDIPHIGDISPVMVSNLFTMQCCSDIDQRQAIPPRPTIPPMDTRVLRARLIIEEMLELVEALGVSVTVRFPEAQEGFPQSIQIKTLDDLTVMPSGVSAFHLDLDPLVDACCDLIYVAVGTMASCGIADAPHLNAVTTANDAKFPSGQPIVCAETGKFQKPEGWSAPAHDPIYVKQGANLLDIARKLHAMNTAPSPRTLPFIEE